MKTPSPLIGCTWQIMTAIDPLLQLIPVLVERVAQLGRRLDVWQVQNSPIMFTPYRAEAYRPSAERAWIAVGPVHGRPGRVTGVALAIKGRALAIHLPDRRP